MEVAKRALNYGTFYVELDTYAKGEVAALYLEGVGKWNG